MLTSKSFCSMIEEFGSSCIWPVCCPPPFVNAGDMKTHSPVCLSVSPSVCLSFGPSVCHINFNLAHIFRSNNDRALIFGMYDPCDKSFLLIPCGDLDL